METQPWPTASAGTAAGRSTLTRSTSSSPRASACGREAATGSARSSRCAPGAPAEVAGRQWDYPAGYNLATRAATSSRSPSATLRGLADGYDLLRLVIETRKDQIARLAWTIVPRGQAAHDAECDESTRGAQFFAGRTGIHGWADWLRLLLEELFVIDAPRFICGATAAGG